MSTFETATDPQKKAVASDHPMMLVMAGPGSGKTRTLIWRIQNLLLFKCRPECIVAITFTNAAADEIQSRLGDVRLNYVGTIHGYVLRLLNQFGSDIGFTGKITVMDEAQAEEFLIDQIAFANVKGTRKAIDAELAAGPPMYPANPMALFAFNYFQALKRANMVSYDALLWFGIELFASERAPDLEPVKYLFVDEYQDSGALLVRLCNKFPIRNRCYVGDPDQSIYSFTGGDVQHINALSHSADTEVIALQENFRCARVICEAAQSLIEHNANRYPKITESATGELGEVTLNTWNDATAEVVGIGLAIQQISIESPEALSDVAVLVRTNELVEHFTNFLGKEFALRQKKYEKMPPDWRRCVLLLSVMVNPRNNYLAQKWVMAKHGPEIGKKAGLRALKEKTSINSIFLNFSTELAVADVPKKLAGEDIGTESICAVNEVLAKLSPGATLSDLLFHIRSGEMHKEEIGQGVTVTTIHSAKGREWGTVFLPALEQHVIPGQRAEPNTEEERRLLFVGITRAKRRLILSWAKKRIRKWGARGPMESEPCQFLKEVKL